jgi:hypothetical protein
MGSIDYGLDRDNSLYVRQYVDFTDPEVQRLNQLANQLNDILSAIMAYSLKTVEVSQAPVATSKRAELHAENIKALRLKYFSTDRKEMSLTDEEFNETLGSIAAQKNLLAALGATQPVMVELRELARRIIMDLQDLEVDVASNIEDDIDEEFSPMVNFFETVGDKKDEIYDAITALHKYERGDKTQISLLKENPAVPASLRPKGNSLTTNQIRGLEKHLTARLQWTDTLYTAAEKDLKFMTLSHKELDKILEYHSLEVRQAAAAIFVWTRAHQTLASGVKDPAKWFGLIAPADLLKMSTKLIF